MPYQGIYESELPVLELLWQHGGMTAKDLVTALHQSIGWSKSTTYTMLKKLVDKGLIQRTDPGFLCHALVSREEVQHAEIDILVNKVFDGRAEKLFTALLEGKAVPDSVLSQLRRQVLESGEEA